MVKSLETRPMYAVIFWYKLLTGFFETALGFLLTVGSLFIPPPDIQTWVLARATGEAGIGLIKFLTYCLLTFSPLFLLHIISIVGVILFLSGTIKLCIAYGLARHSDNSMRVTISLVFLSAVGYFVDVWNYFSWFKVFIFLVEGTTLIYLWHSRQRDEYEDKNDSFNPAP